ncbi:MAG: hypothetical protein R2839_04860 [Thermomicrobiales bacterium]
MRIELTGEDALAALEHLSCSRIDRPTGRVTYSLLLNERGGIESDVTIGSSRREPLHDDVRQRQWSP